MKNIFSVFTLAIIAISCSTKNKNKFIDKDHLNGTWIFGKANKIDNAFQDFSALKSSELGEYSPVLSFIEFDAKDKVWYDTGGIAPIPGKYDVKDSALTISFEGNTIPDLKLTVMPTLDTSRYRLYRPYKGTTDFEVYEINRITSHSVVGAINLLKPLSDSVDEKAIVDKIRRLARYYGQYCVLVNKYNNQFFKMDRLNLPFKLYSGGIGLNEIKDWDPEFKKIMGTEANQKVAFQKLKETFKVSYNYPSLGSNLLEYNDALNFIAKNIK